MFANHTILKSKPARKMPIGPIWTVNRAMSGSYLKFSSLLADATENLPFLTISEHAGQMTMDWR
jgi:hypothetical protein